VSGEPFAARTFAVELRLPGSDEPLCQAAFRECEGLELRRAIATVHEGGDERSVRLLPGHESFGNVTLRRGMTAALHLWLWWEQGVRATCDVVVLSPDLTAERVRFRLHGCLPVRVAGPRLDAMTSDLAIETLELACERIEVLRPGAPLPPAPQALVKAQLRELDARFEREINRARSVAVQINPHELRTSFAHEPTPRTQLDLRLIFDVRAPTATGRAAPDDVRRLTEKVAYFATPRPARGGALARPAVRLVWGTFQFDGHLEALEETLDAFSPDGRPLRAALALSLVQTHIAPYAFAGQT
jgi:phage tail-like protein